VLVDSEAVSGCLYLAVFADGTELVTVEGLADGDTLHPVQEAFIEARAFQCGFCTPGFVLMTPTQLLAARGPGEQPCAPLLPYGGRRGLIKSHLRSTVAPWIDCRQPVDIIRIGWTREGLRFCGNQNSCSDFVSAVIGSTTPRCCCSRPRDLTLLLEMTTLRLPSYLR
jgi:hypothetical protein